MGVERRKHTRVPFDAAIRVRRIDGSQSMGALGCDLSEGGLRFTTDRFVGVNHKLLMEFEMPLGGRPLRIVGKPAWVRQLGTSESYEVGNLFLELSEEDQGAIRDFVAFAQA